MKKFLLSFLAITALSTMSFAQVKDIAVAIDAPTAGTSIEAGVAFDMSFTVSNAGSVDLVVTDSVYYGIFLGGQNLFGTTILLADRTNGTVAPGESWTVTFPGLNFSEINIDGANDMCIQVFLYEGTAAAPTTEDDVANNQNCRSFNFVMGSTASLEDGLVAGTTSIDAYPNPAIDQVNFEITGTDAERIEITNLAGQAVAQVEVNAETETVDVSGLESGVYIYTLYTSKGAVTSEKLVIK